MLKFLEDKTLAESMCAIIAVFLTVGFCITFLYYGACRLMGIEPSTSDIVNIFVASATLLGPIILVFTLTEWKRQEKYKTTKDAIFSILSIIQNIKVNTNLIFDYMDNRVKEKLIADLSNFNVLYLLDLNQESRKLANNFYQEALRLNRLGIIDSGEKTHSNPDVIHEFILKIINDIDDFTFKTSNKYKLYNVHKEQYKYYCGLGTKYNEQISTHARLQEKMKKYGSDKLAGLDEIEDIRERKFSLEGELKLIESKLINILNQV